MKRLTLVLIALISLNTWAKDLTQEMDALGANQDLMKKAQAIDAKNQVRVVQNREVDRNYRLELGVNYGTEAAGNDPYVNTSMLGGQLDFHINPHWSVGARYTSYQNKLSSEGQSVFDNANARRNAGQNYTIPAYSWAKDSELGVINWYPIYGKMNMFDAGVTQFDMYLIGGAGQVNLATGSAPLYTAGAGMGIWIAKHITTRLEARWEGHSETLQDGSNRNMNETVLSATVGFLL